MQKSDIKLYLFYVLFFFTAITYAGKKINKDKVILNSVPSISINLDTIVYFNTAVLSDLDLKDTVKKVFKSKNGAGLQNYKSIKITDSASVVNSATADAFQYEFYENAITVLSNINAIIPIKKLEQQKIAYVKIGNADNEAFISTLQKYADVTVIEDTNTDRLQRKLARYTTVIIGYHKIDNVFENYGFTSDEIAKIKFLSGNNNVILNVFANPYCLSAIDSFENIKGLIVSYQNKTVAQIVSAELIFGAIQAKGKLPFSIKPYFKGNEGLSTEKLDRLGFTYAENVGMDAAVLSKIDVIANKAITEKMTPGIQVLVARKGKVIYQKSFGYHTYENIIKVQNSDIYDVASLTKIMATLPNVMLQYDRKKINLETNLGEMLPNFIGSNKEKINLKDLLSHYAGLAAGLSFSNAALNSSKGLSEVYFRKKAEINFTKQLADSLFIRNDFSDIMMQMIINSKLSDKKESTYLHKKHLYLQ